MGRHIYKISTCILLLSLLLSCAPETAALDAGDTVVATTITEVAGGSVTGDTADVYGKPPKYNKDNSVSVTEYGAAGDGITDDGEAIRLAFEATQETGKTLYFPAGRYNMYGMALHPEKPFSIAGDENGGSVLLDPGAFTCYSDIDVRDLKVLEDDEGVFLNLQLTGPVSIYINGVTYTSSVEFNNKSRFIYCKTESNTDYIEYVEITNCDISNVMYGIQLQSRIDSGLIEGNRITKLGNPKELVGVAAMKLGFPNSGKVYATNLIIRDNFIKDICTAYAKEAETCEAQGILLYSSGGCVIENNYLENIIGGNDHEGIYVKATDIRILDNTLVNAGDGCGSIVNKTSTEKNDVIISGNTIINNIESIRVMCGIVLTCERFTVTDNTIIMKSGIAIYKAATDTKGAIITGNTIKTNGRTAVYIQDITGKLIISGNLITHELIDDKTDAAFKLYLSGKYAEIDLYGNEVTVSDTRFFWITYNKKGGAVSIHDNILTKLGVTIAKDKGLARAKFYANTINDAALHY